MGDRQDVMSNRREWVYRRHHKIVRLCGPPACSLMAFGCRLGVGRGRDAIYLLETLLDPQTSVRPQHIVTDTAGYSDIMVGLFRLLGFQFSP
jgi:Tn3 transposase DDE domain